MSLYRAIAYMHEPYGTLDDSECIVFFEAAPGEHHAALMRLLAAAWRAPEEHIEAYNVNSEAELLSSWAFGDASSGDARLLETGSGPQGSSYAQPDRTLMFVRPATLRRLAAAQRRVAPFSATEAA